MRITCKYHVIVRRRAGAALATEGWTCTTRTCSPDSSIIIFWSVGVFHSSESGRVHGRRDRSGWMPRRPRTPKATGPGKQQSREEKRSRERKPTPPFPSSLGHVVVHIHDADAAGSTRRGEEMRWIKEKSLERWWWWRLPTCAGDADRCHPQVGGSPVRVPPPL